eukprot:TRINITY_DN3455_c0_g1_i1.p1 TRINITY_DN3455_c0_g1~~TRINITY_DN3455_c0_g1_i1.p1  ORF type:complete len:463 (+),score=100.32 TRINITY_DN3455_c0_g1_i1:2654-4042(+)
MPPTCSLDCHQPGCEGVLRPSTCCAEEELPGGRGGAAPPGAAMAMGLVRVAFIAIAFIAVVLIGTHSMMYDKLHAKAAADMSHEVRRGAKPVATAGPMAQRAISEPTRSSEPKAFEPTIFVSIAAFRDPECQNTVREIYSKAKRPGRVHLGVVCQRDMDGDADEVCVPPDMADNPSYTIRLNDAPAASAKGPTWARHLAAEMYKGEDYFFMIDAHNKFIENWDEDILAQHAACDTPGGKCVLTVYPMGYESAPHPQQHVPHLCKNARWTRGFPGPFLGQVYGESTQPRPQPFLGGGLVFGPGQMVLDVPFDPHLPHVFFGEEILQAVRLWTSGYDLFSPSRNVLFHHYGRNTRRAHTRHANQDAEIASAYKRIEYLLEIPDPMNPPRPLVDEVAARADPAAWAEIEKYGMGNVRNVSHYWKFSRLDLLAKTHERTNDYWCGTYGGQPPFSNQWKAEAGYPGF